MVAIIKPRRYFSARARGEGPATPLDLDSVKSMFLAAHGQFAREGYWDETFGYGCVDQGDVPGTAGEDRSAYVLLHTRKPLWPLTAQHVSMFDEADLFDMIEFLFDHVSKPLKGSYHQYADCGMHWETFDRSAGQHEFRDAMSDLLDGYGPGYQLNERGEIMELGPKAMSKLLNAVPPSKDADVNTRMNKAIDRFQRYRSSLDDRRHAVRDLADILEKLRPQMKEVLHRKDEADLFNIANNFSIRHADEKQKSDYDPAVWLSWMFYFYLATINACLHLSERKTKK